MQFVMESVIYSALCDFLGTRVRDTSHNLEQRQSTFPAVAIIELVDK